MKLASYIVLAGLSVGAFLAPASTALENPRASEGTVAQVQRVDPMLPEFPTDTMSPVDTTNTTNSFYDDTADTSDDLDSDETVNTSTLPVNDVHAPLLENPDLQPVEEAAPVPVDPLDVDSNSGGKEPLLDPVP